LGVPALLPQRRELGWPNRGAATTPGADVGGWPRLWGPRVDRRVDDGPRRSDHGESNRIPPGWACSPRSPSRGPRTGGPGLLKRGRRGSAPGSSARKRSSPRCRRRPVVVTGHGTPGHTAPIPVGPRLGRRPAPRHPTLRSEPWPPGVKLPVQPPASAINRRDRPTTPWQIISDRGQEFIPIPAGQRPPLLRGHEESRGVVGVLSRRLVSPWCVRAGRSRCRSR